MKLCDDAIVTPSKGAIVAGAVPVRNPLALPVGISGGSAEPGEAACAVFTAIKKPSVARRYPISLKTSRPDR